MNLNYEQLCKKSNIELYSICYGVYNNLKIIFDKIKICFYLKKEKRFENYDLFYKEVIKTWKRLNLKHKYLQNLIDYSTIIKVEKNKTIYILRLYSEYYYNNLNFEINNYKKKNLNIFSQDELIKLIYQILMVMYFLQLENRIHGNLNLEMIRINNEKNYILNDNYKESSNYFENQMNNFIDNEKLYLSPEMLKIIINKDNKMSFFNFFKNEVFALGLIFLECSLLKLIDIYQYKTLDKNLLKLEIYNMEKKYFDNPLIIEIIKSMLEVDPLNRPDFIDLMESLPKLSLVEDIFNEKTIYYQDVNIKNIKSNEEIIINRLELQKEKTFYKDKIKENNIYNKDKEKNIYNLNYKKPKVSNDLIELQKIGLPTKNFTKRHNTQIIFNSVKNKNSNNLFNFKRKFSIKPPKSPWIKNRENL